MSQSRFITPTIKDLLFSRALLLLRILLDSGTTRPGTRKQRMALLKSALALALAVSAVRVQSNAANSSFLLEPPDAAICAGGQVYTVVESETVIRTYVPAPTTLDVGGELLTITAPTSVDTTITISSTLTESVTVTVNGNAVAQTAGGAEAGSYAYGEADAESGGFVGYVEGIAA